MSMCELCEKYHFDPEYFENYQCKPEIILLASSLFWYLESCCIESDRNIANIVFFLRNSFVDEDNACQESNVDLLFKDAERWMNRTTEEKKRSYIDVDAFAALFNDSEDNISKNTNKDFSGIDNYKMFKHASAAKQKDAIITLYSYYISVE